MVPTLYRNNQRTPLYIRFNDDDDNGDLNIELVDESGNSIYIIAFFDGESGWFWTCPVPSHFFERAGLAYTEPDIEGNAHLFIKTGNKK